ncbi:hypothetical protein [Xylophilus ampelinus]|uniref:Uncharacterized protein n=1 Tax=Xylophilus ampelinus TaxID=54067 RepID=A0A318SQX1_9BURK|nr:hypothetical protein [Xylophilus ampelinus]MCS4508924.1 hypothetical protein [Xylophilus ampelinus]PYE79490.1 hypothetical protein DFQ15_102223 [Xylophilus ampelinus]
MNQISNTSNTIQAEATSDQPSPTSGMNMAQRIQHVGGRNPPGSTYVEFGSIQAVEALVAQVLRDQKQAEHQIIEAFLERTGQYVTNDATRKAAIADAVAQALSPKRGTDAQIVFERELTCAAIDGAMAFGYRGGPAPAGDSQWLLPFYKVGADQARLERTGQAVTNDARTDAARLDGLKAGWNFAIAGQDAKYDAAVLALGDSVTTLRKEARATPPEAATAEAAGKAPASVPRDVLQQALDALTILDARPSPMCRDCADCRGPTCPSSGLPCDMDRLLNQLRAALAAQPRSTT